MEEALMLFEEISNSLYFKRAAMILFLNKIDLLQEKLQSGISPIRRYYPDYKEDPNDVQLGQKYFADKFKQKRKDKDSPLFIHYTNATDTTLLEATMNNVDNIILHRNINAFILD